MSHNQIDGLLLREMLLAGASLLEEKREEVDALNVFPVPDGDTGTNMSMTIRSAVRELSSTEQLRADRAAEAVAKGALRGARGNSGVILSQLLRGFARGLEGCESITPVKFAEALKSAADTAYKAVMKPKEGTILTVARVIGETAIAHVQQNSDDMESLFTAFLNGGEAILRKTPDLLPALKQAGVVDAGGRGLLLIYTGMNAALRGEQPISSAPLSEIQKPSEEFIDDHESIGEIQFSYCTEFIIQNLRPGVSDDDVSLLRRKLNRIGDCVLVVSDLEIVKVHVHTNDPGKALQDALLLGELINLKIENMVEQRRERLRQQARQSPLSEVAFVSVSLGEGFANMFKELGVAQIVDGGQTMNPSIEDLGKAIDAAHAKNVFVFPNNSNVILAAQQAASISKCNVFVIPTKNVAMGIAGVIAYMPDETPEHNAEIMKNAAERVKTGMITNAIRDSHFEDLEIHEGDCIGLYNGKISACDPDIFEVVRTLMEMLVTEDDSLITIYYGSDISKEDAEALADEFTAKYDFCDVEVQNGGQPVYGYVIAVE